MRPKYLIGCTTACEHMPTCATCGRRKAPVGRAVGPESNYCDRDCPGYTRDPYPGHLWPGELARIDQETDNVELLDSALQGVESESIRK